MNDTNNAVQAYTMAMTQILLKKDKMEGGVMIVGGDELGADSRIGIGRVAVESQVDIIHLAFEAAEGGNVRMTGMTLFMPCGPICVVQPDCRLWLAMNGTRAVIVPRDEADGHFRLSPAEVIHVDRGVSGDVDAGIQRADRWINRWLQTHTVAPSNANFYEVAEAA